MVVLGRFPLQEKVPYDHNKGAILITIVLSCLGWDPFGVYFNQEIS